MPRGDIVRSEINQTNYNKSNSDYGNKSNKNTNPNLMTNNNIEEKSSPFELLKNRDNKKD